MRAISSSTTVVLALSLLVACGAPAAAPSSPASPPPSTTGATPGARPTDSFRREHVEIKEHLEHIDAAVGKLASAPPDEQRRIMTHVVGFLDGHIKPHAEWEERVLYAAVDRRAATGPNAFTSTMRYEHRVVARWIGELAAESVKASPDAKAFARRADNLLGLLWAHFEEEEEVLLPILDRSMSPAEFDREIGAHGK